MKSTLKMYISYVHLHLHLLVLHNKYLVSYSECLYINNVRCMPKPFVNYESVEIKSISIRLQYFKAIITVNNNNHSIIQ